LSISKEEGERKKVMSIQLSNDAATNLLEHIEESMRLKELSDLDLIRECMKSEVSDDPLVLALMDRVRPGWLEEL
jgi:hypothetical protein